MGSPLSPVIANVFLCNFENQYLEQCDPTFKPDFYRRYLDDTFILFRNSDKIDSFFNYFNSIHPNIKFTREVEVNQQLPFLDVTVQKDNGVFITSVFRKTSFTGKGTNYFSDIYEKYKHSAINTLLQRAYCYFVLYIL